MAAAFGVPDLFIRKAINARRELNKLLLNYYQNGSDRGQDVSEIIKQRTIFLRSTGFTDEDLSEMELMLLWAGVTNTAPALFWLFVHVLTNPEYTSRVQAEISAITTITTGIEGRTATLNIKQLEKSCPFLNACLQETLRLYFHSVGNRRVMQDTKIQDAEGRKYLLKKGCNIQWPPSVTHFVSDVWGSDVESFKPERVLDATPQDKKNRRGSMLSFGGGKNLCPGRKFAQTEVLGYVGVVALGFEVEGLKLPRWKDAGVGAGPRVPDWGSVDAGVRLKRKKGWEDVTWSFDG
jgi:cytochrome P450